MKGAVVQKELGLETVMLLLKYLTVKSLDQARLVKLTAIDIFHINTGLLVPGPATQNRTLGFIPYH